MNQGGMWRVMTAMLGALGMVPSLWAGHNTEAFLPADKVPAFAISRMSSPPTIDGAITPEEWREATAIGGMADLDDVLLPRPTTFYMGWDEGHLYFAARVYVRAGYKPTIRDGRSHNLAYVWDDGLELHWQPMGANIRPDNVGSSYKWFLNCIGFIGDCQRNTLGQQFKNWNPKFNIKTRLTEPGTAPDGGHWWEMEMSATPEDFELNGPHRAGDTWRAMFGFNHMPIWLQARIPCNGPYLDPFGYNVLTLVENTPAIQVIMESIPNLATDGTAALTVRAFNAGKVAVNLSVDVSVTGAEDAKPLIERTETLAVAPGQTAELVLNEKLPETAKAGWVNVRVRQDARELYRYTARYKVGSHAHMMAPVTPPDPNKFDFRITFNPVRGQLRLKGDTYYLEDPSQAKALRYRVTRDGQSKPMAEGRATVSAEYYLQDIVELPRLAPATYRVEAVMELVDGSELGPMSVTFEKKDEAKAFPQWWGKTFGDVERVLKPFTGVKRKGDTVSVILRDYQLSALGLPVSITAKDGLVSAAPARLIVVIDGTEHTAPLGKPKFTKTTDWRVTFKGQTKVAGLDVTAEGWVEQDGLVYVDLTYKPSGKVPVKVDAMRIEYPLAEGDADALLCIGPGGNYSSRTTMLLPKPGSSAHARTPSASGRGGDAQGQRLWSTLDTGISGSGMTVGSFYPMVWIGSERRGFLWWSDHDRGWVQDDAVPAHEAVRKDGAVVLINNIVAKPIDLSEARTISFSYNATPFKPLPKGWRASISTEDGTFMQPFRGVRKDSKTGEMVLPPGSGAPNWIHPESRYPEEWDDLWREQKVSADAHFRNWIRRDPYRSRHALSFTHMSFQILGYGRKSIEDAVHNYFGPEWEGGSFETWNESQIDYAMSLFDPAFKIGGVRSTYWDIAMPATNTDPLSGQAYFLPDGRVQRGYNTWNVRRFMMRLHALQLDAGLVPGANGFHSTNSYIPVAMPWVDSVLDGERHWDLDSSPNNWVDNMPIERMRAMSVPQNWGVSICWMSAMMSKTPEKVNAARRAQADWVWMHDMWRNPYLDQFGMMLECALDWGLNSADTAYHPHWRNPAVTGDDPAILVSLWQIPSERHAILGVFNHDGKAVKDAVLTIDLAKLGLPAAQALARTLYGAVGVQAELGTSGGVTTLRMKALPAHRLTLVGIASPEAAELARATKGLPIWVDGDLPAAVVDFGLVRRETRHFAPGQTPGVACENAAIEVGMWQLPDRVMFAVYNKDETAKQDATLNLDLAVLGLEQKLIWQEFTDVRQLLAEEKAPTPAFDYDGAKLTVPGLPPKGGRLVTVRRY